LIANFLLGHPFIFLGVFVVAELLNFDGSYGRGAVGSSVGRILQGPSQITGY